MNSRVRIAALSGIQGQYVVPTVLACIFVSLVGTDVPALRHDWYWPPAPQLFPALAGVLGGWHVEGIGSVYAYPSDYVLNVILTLLRHFIGDRGAFVVSAFGVAATCASAAWRLAIGVRCNAVAACALATLALLNPWTYNEVVAGHLFMVLAYGCMLHLVVNAREGTLESRGSLFAIVFLLQQIQFFLVVMAALAVLCVARHRFLRQFSFGLILYLPVWAGIVLDYRDLLSIPYIGKWEVGQSVDPSHAPVLLGYFAAYAERSIASGALQYVWYAFTVLVAACAALLLWRRKLPAWTLVSAAASILVAEGLKGLLAPAALWAITYVPQTAIYRELYDVLAFATIAYLVLIALGASSSKIVSFCAAGIALAAVCVWALHPPSSWWVAASSIPSQQRIASPPQTRFALLPAFQPLSYNGRGSGIDPDWYVTSGDRTPVNDVLPQYPEDAALAAFQRHGETSALAALSVATIVNRPWLAGVVGASALPGAAAPPSPRERVAFQRPVHGYTPEFDVISSVRTINAIPAIGSGNVFFGDTGAGVGVMSRPSASRYETDLSRAWVDVRLEYLALPELGQPFGGAVTTSTSALLPIAARSVLAFVRGRMYAVGPSGASALRTERGSYAWTPLPVGTGALRCDGLCAVALASSVPMRNLPHDLASNRARVGTPAAFRQINPWLALVQVRQTRGILRYNVRWSKTWTAFSGGTRLAHLKLDGVTNGWRLQGHGGTILVLHGASLLQFAFEIFAMLYAAVQLAHKPKRKHG